MTSTEFLLFVKGPAFTFAVLVFVIGMIIRLAEILMLGRKQNLAEPKGSEFSHGLKTIGLRMIPDKQTWRHSTFFIVTSYVFHIGFFVVLFLFVPHILLFDSVFGFKWPGLPTPVVDAFAIVTIASMIAILVNRFTDPVKRFLSHFEDYLVWAVTFLPLLTGYLAYHRLIFKPDQLLAMHILSFELLLVLFPFTKLSHAFTLFFARWYNGAIAGFKGVQS
ncbi:MAG: hypothetical protein KDJ38_05765 [Gammaproteobacteria bacterium]|nr:hypothetical protein [Gammaproteobacteria bacterium]